MTWPDLEKAYVMALMEKFNWNITWAAKASGINRSTFASRMRKLDIHRGTGAITRLNQLWAESP